MKLDGALRMMEFALGVYGWPYYVWDAPCSPARLAALARNCTCCACAWRQTLVTRDNACRCHTAAFRLQTRLGPGDLFHVSFANEGLMEIPFVVAADPETASVVVAIRGTLSLRDAVTDLCAADTSLRLRDEDQADAAVRVHKGILSAARSVHDTLLQNRILEDVRVLYPDYALTITGHSLGGGVAAVLALLLQPAHPAVRCFAFSPPGCVLSAPCLPLVQDVVLSVVVGDDLVSRLSYNSMRSLKADIIEAISTCDRPKHTILLTGCSKLLCATGQRHSVNHEGRFAMITSGSSLT